MAVGIKVPKPGKTGTPVGMEGVRPGSPKAVAAGFKPPSSPKPPKPPKPVVGAAAAGTTIQAPPVPTTRTVTTSTPPGMDWWTSQMGAQVGLSATAPVLSAQQNQIGSSYGLTLRRDVVEGSPTKGQPLFRLPSEKSGEGTVRQTGFDDKGNPVYKDGAGNVVADPTTLALDYVALKPGEAGYLQGALGSAAAQSANTQQTIAQNAALRGAGRSGMREFGARGETAALQSALAGLGQKAAGEYVSNLGDWAKLYQQIYQGLVPQAAALAEPTTTTVEVPAESGVATGAGAAPPYLGYNQAPTPAPGTLSGGPGGAFMTLIGDVTLERNTNDAQIRRNLRALLNNPSYQLTAQQKAYINSLITGRYKGNKKY